MQKRCSWPGQDELYISYHDRYWGVPVTDEKELFAKLILDGAQAGLSWITILRRQDNYYRAFDQLDPYKMAEYDRDKQDQLLMDSGIIRNKAKIHAAILNARGFVEIKKREGSFSRFLWQFVNNQPINNHYSTLKEVPPHTPHSDAMSKALKEYGFKFCGTTICYAFMQAVGMVNDHLTICFRHNEISEMHRHFNLNQQAV